MAKATILIPNYNNALYMEACLNSIQKQTFKDFKILIVDDGSTDNSIEIIQNFIDDRIELIHKTPNSGIVDTLNMGLKKITSDYMIRMDGDDLMREDRVEKLVKFMDENPEFGVCGSGIEQFGLSDKKVIYETDPIKNKANLVFQHTIGHASCIFRMSVMSEHNISYSNGYKLLEDYKIFSDLSQITKLTSIPDLLYLYRQEDYNQEHVYVPVKKPGFLKIYTELLTKLQFENPEKSALIHYELHKNVELTHTIKTYKAHISSLISQNEQLNIFPREAFNEKVNYTFDVFFYKLVDQNKISFRESILLTAFSPKKMYYFIKSKR